MTKIDMNSFNSLGCETVNFNARRPECHQMVN